MEFKNHDKEKTGSYEPASIQRSDSDLDESQLDLTSYSDSDVLNHCPNLVCSVLHTTHRLLKNVLYCRL